MNAPKTIDYLSLDVEGSESQTLNGKGLRISESQTLNGLRISDSESEILRPFPFTGSGEDEVSHAERLQYSSSLSSGPASAPDFSCGRKGFPLSVSVSFTNGAMRSGSTNA